MKRQKALRLLSSHSRDIAAHGVRSLTLFGSVARDEAQRGSDVDLLVEFARPAGYFELIGLQNYLEGLFGCSVDLGTVGALGPGMRKSVMDEAIHVPTELAGEG